jgi:hypothetical protein
MPGAKAVPVRSCDLNREADFIAVASVASFAIHPLGHDVEIGLVAPDDRRFILKLHPDTLATIFALIPKMLELALERLTGDGGARQVFGLEGWKIDAVNDGSASVVTLCAADGFKISFLAAADTAVQLAQALHQQSSEVMTHIATTAKH